VLISSAFAGGGFISSKMYNELVPDEHRLTEAVKAEGIPVYTHTCGKIGERHGMPADSTLANLNDEANLKLLKRQRH
jgi:hypothetical protein